MESEPGAEPFEGWITAFRGPLIGLLASWGSDWRAADELAQDVFAEAWMSRARFVGDPTSLEVVGAWLRGIAFRLHSSTRRKERRRASLSLEHTDPPSPAFEVDERHDALARAFVRLSDAHQTVLRMHYLEETSAREVAALLGLTSKAVEDRLYQARKALRELVERDARITAQGVRA